MKKSIQFCVEPLSTVIDASQNRTILESLLDAGIDIDHSCGGNGTCGTCRIRIDDHGKGLHEANETERELRNEIPFHANERLACQTYPCEGLVIHLREKKFF